MNNVSIIGRIATAPDVIPVEGNRNVCKFSIAVDSRVLKATNQKQTWFFVCEAWDDVGKRIFDYVSKGERVGITGHLAQDCFIRRDGSKGSQVKIVVSSCEFLESKKSKDDSTSDKKSEETSLIKDDDIPF